MPCASYPSSIKPTSPQLLSLTFCWSFPSFSPCFFLFTNTSNSQAMATSRLARLFMEVAPPQYVTVMRHRTSKMLDTITEEERETSPSDSAISSPKSSSASSSTSASSASPAAVAATATIASANNTKYFLKEVHRSLSILNH